MKKIFFLLFCFISFTGFSQSKNSTIEKDTILISAYSNTTSAQKVIIDSMVSIKKLEPPRLNASNKTTNLPKCVPKAKLLAQDIIKDSLVNCNNKQAAIKVN